MDPKETACSHEYVITNAYTGGTEYTCKHCGHKKTATNLPENASGKANQPAENAGYVLTDPNKTVNLYSDTLHLTNESTGKDAQFTKQAEKTIGGRYKALQLLGHGGFFKTYFVIDEKCNKKWAMKVCDKTHKSYSHTLREIILQEPHMMMKLHHPAIPRVLDIVEDETKICIIREYVEGQALDALVNENGPIKQETVLEWAKQLCDVLGYLHKQTPPYIYRDMKPANVVLQPCGKVKLIDFGAVKVYDALLKQDDCVLGTRGYAAPEAFCGATDQRSDLFSLGMTMHHLVTGINPNTPPFETKPIRQINPQLSAGLEAIIARCICPNPNDRFQSCEKLMRALESNTPNKTSLFSKLFGKK